MSIATSHGLYSDIVPSADCNRAKALTAEATTLSQQILDARLALTRLRQAHPHPRLTVATASAHLESQVMQMQEFDEKVQDVNDCVASVKEKVKESAREVERLRVKRAEVENGVKTGEVEVEDGRVVGLYDWYVQIPRECPQHPIDPIITGSQHPWTSTAQSCPSFPFTPHPKTPSY